MSYLPKMRTQVVAARTVAEALVDIATDSEWNATGPIPEIAGLTFEEWLDSASATKG